MATDGQSTRDLDQGRLEALIETMFLAAQADEEFTQEERQQFAAAVESLTDRRIVGPALAALVTKIEGAVKKDGRSARLQIIKTALGDTAARKTAVSLAIRMLAADGIIRTSEREFLLEIAEALDVDRDVAADLVKQIAG